MADGDRRIWALSFAHLLTDLYSPVLPAVLPLLILTHGYSYLTAGLLVTIYNLTSSVTQPFFGWFSDRRGKGIPVEASLAVSAIFIGLVGIAPDLPLLALCAGLGALGHATFHPSAMASAGRLCTDSTRGRLMSFFVIGGNLGFALGPLFAGIAVGMFGLPGILLLIIPGLSMALLGRRFLPEGVGRRATPIPPPAGKKDIGRTSAIAMTILVGAAGLRAWAIFASLTYIPVLLVARGFDLWMANLLMTIMLLAGVAGQVIGGTLSDRFGRKEYTIAGMLCALPPLWIFLSTGGALAILAMFAFGFFLWSTFAVSVAIAQELLPDHVGLASGLILGLAIGCGGIGVAATGSMADGAGLVPALLALIAPVLVSVFLFMVLPYPWRIRSLRRTFGRRFLRDI